MERWLHGALTLSLAPLLLVQGRDDNDLITAVKGIAQGNILFRGSSVTVDDVKQLQARKPYGAPNWVRTDRAVTFAELKTYEQQLQSSGLVPDAINLALNLPPDLYLLRANGIAAGFCYQLLGFEDEHDPHRVLHGLNAVWISERQVWRRLDARGNKPGVDAQFLPYGAERLAFTVHPQFGEVDYPHIFAEPDPGLVALLLAPIPPTLDQVLPRLPQGLAP